MNYSNFEDTNVVLLTHCELPRGSRRSDMLAIGGAAVAAALQPNPQLVVNHLRTVR